jgi:peptide chain release factor 1
MLDKLQQVEIRYQELTSLLGDPATISDREIYRKFTKEHAELEPVVQCFRELRTVLEELKGSKTIVEEERDDELRKLALADVESLKGRKDELERKLQLLLLPKDPNDQKNIILEIRAGTGGEEAALFASELFGAYTRYAQGRGWGVELMSRSDAAAGGLKEVIARIVGNGAYSAFKYERGVHRVQRVPKTETQGRVHTSTITVAALPEAEEVDVELLDKDLRIDVFRASGPGGQSVNTTDSAVRITHIPTGLVVSCQDEKSQIKNKVKGLAVLRSRLLAHEQEKLDVERRDDRRSQIGTGERSEKIRTYNFPQSRVTDHRIGLSVHQIDEIMAGRLELLIDPLVSHFQAEALKGSS